MSQTLSWRWLCLRVNIRIDEAPWNRVAARNLGNEVTRPTKPLKRHALLILACQATIFSALHAVSMPAVARDAKKELRSASVARTIKQRRFRSVPFQDKSPTRYSASIDA